MSRMTDIAWAAGIFEGEGSFYMSDKYQAQIKLAMTDRDVVERFSTVMGCGNISKMKKEKPHHRQAWMWRVSSWAEFAKVTDLIGSFLGERRTQRMDEILTFMPDPLPTPNGEKTHCSRGHRYSPENTRWVKSGRGRARQCVRCNRKMARDRKRRKAAR